MPHDYMSIQDELEERAIRLDAIEHFIRMRTDSSMTDTEILEHAVNWWTDEGKHNSYGAPPWVFAARSALLAKGYVTCSRCHRARREDTYCQCVTAEEHEYRDAMVTHPDQRTARQRELVATGLPKVP